MRRRRQLIVMFGGGDQPPPAGAQGGQASTVASIRALKRDLVDLEQQVRETIKNSPAHQQKIAMLQQVPGVSPQLRVRDRRSSGTGADRTTSDRRADWGRTARAREWQVQGPAHDLGRPRRCGVRCTWRCSVRPAATRCWLPFPGVLCRAEKAKSLRTSPRARKLLVILNAMFRDRITSSPTLDFQHSR